MSIVTMIAVKFAKVIAWLAVSRDISDDLASFEAQDAGGQVGTEL
jgi:hypothetical protein